MKTVHLANHKKIVFTFFNSRLAGSVQINATLRAESYVWA
jgi:hypothetical protein